MVMKSDEILKTIVIFPPRKTLPRRIEFCIPQSNAENTFLYSVSFK